MTELRITLAPPHRCLSPNARCHFMAKANAVKAYRFDAGIKARAFIGRAKCPAWKRATAQATFYVKVNRRRDADNALASLKPVFDGLRDAGVIDDDSGLVHLPVEFVVDKRRPRVEVTVRQIKEV